MKTTQRRLAAAVSLGLSAALALSTGAAPAQAGGSADARAAASDQLTDFGYRADVYGVKLVTDNVEALNLKDAHAQLLCTRAVGQVVEQQSVVLASRTTRSSTSRPARAAPTPTPKARPTASAASTPSATSASAARSPLTTPRLVIEGLQTTAHAFHTPQGYGHDEGFDFASITLDLLDGTVVRQLRRSSSSCSRPSTR